MRENKCKPKNPHAREQEMSFDEFVDSLFAFAGDPHRIGLSVQRNDGHYTCINVIHFDRKVIVNMDGVDMGFFEELNMRGYKCRFNQRNRAHIHEGLFPNEILMKEICDHPFVLFHEA